MVGQFSIANAHVWRKRGQQSNTDGHGRAIEAKLSDRHEDFVLDKAQCPECGLTFREFAGTEDVQVLEIDVKANGTYISGMTLRSRA